MDVIRWKKIVLQLYHSKFYLILMLSKLQNLKISNQNHFCNCSLIKQENYLPEQGNILISHHRQISQLASLRTSTHKRVKNGSNKPKTSLRASRVCIQKQNFIGNSKEESCNNSIIDQLKNETIPYTHSKPSHAYQHLEQRSNNVKTSIFFAKVERPKMEQSKKQTNYCENNQKQASNQIVKVNSGANYRNSIRKSKQSNTQFQIIYDSKCRTQDDILSKEQIVMQEHMGSLVVSKKKTKIFHKLQLLQFKSTQSINDSSSNHNSSIVSDFYFQDQSLNHSQRNFAKINKLSQLIRTKYSRMTQNKRE